MRCQYDELETFDRCAKDALFRVDELHRCACWYACTWHAYHTGPANGVRNIRRLKESEVECLS